MGKILPQGKYWLERSLLSDRGESVVDYEFDSGMKKGFLRRLASLFLGGCLPQTTIKGGGLMGSIRTIRYLLATRPPFLYRGPKMGESEVDRIDLIFIFTLKIIHKVFYFRSRTLTKKMYFQ